MPTIPLRANAPTTKCSPIGWVSRIIGAGMLFASGGIHLDLYLTGYRHIPTIGVLFLLQVISAFALAASVLVTQSRLVAMGAAFFPLTTLGGYILSLWTGLFGFYEVRTEAGIVAGAFDIAAFAALAMWAVMTPDRSHAVAPRLVDATRHFSLPILALAALALILAEANVTSSVMSNTRQSTAAATGAAVKVKILNFAFIPADVHATPGERIIVHNDDSVAHTFTAIATGGARPTFDSGDIAPGATVTVVAPGKVGTYPFDCEIHQFMTGVLDVIG